MTFQTPPPYTGHYTINKFGVQRDANGEFATWADASAEWNRRIIAAQKPLTPEQESDKWFAIHGVPSEKSLKNLDAKLAAIKRAEEIENRSEEM